MYILKNSILNIKRNKGRNILVGIVMVIIAITSVISLVINSATTNIITDYKSQFGSEVDVELDYARIYENGNINELPNVTYEELKSYADSDYIKDYYFYLEAPGYSGKIKALDQEDDLGMEGSSGAIGAGQELPRPNIKIIGSTSYELFKEFKSGERKIIDGKIFQKENEVAISEELAKANKLKVGDTILVRSIADVKKDIPLTITGIYQDLSKLPSGTSYKDPYMNRRNEVLTNYETAVSLVGEQANMMSRIKYFLKSPDDLQVFEKEARDKGLSEYYTFNNNENLYKQIAAPVESVQKISRVFLIVVLILGAIILILLNLISLRERKYEIGVLRAIGMRKFKVVRTILYESIIVTMIAVALGLGIGSITAKPVSDKLLADQIQQRQEQLESLSGNLGGTSMAIQEDKKIIDSLDVKLDGGIIIGIFIIGGLLVIASSSISLVYITKYEPIKILSERN